MNTGIEMKITINASYIPSRENTEADRESRITNVDTEWELNGKYFNKIVKKWGNPEIDLFATRKNRKCSRFRDPGTQLIDACTQDWANWNFYAFPPFSVILKTITKL